MTENIAGVPNNLSHLRNVFDSYTLSQGSPTFSKL